MSPVRVTSIMVSKHKEGKFVLIKGECWWGGGREGFTEMMEMVRDGFT